MIGSALDQLRSDQSAIGNLVKNYQVQHRAQICTCLRKIVGDCDPSGAPGLLKKAIASLVRINESGVYLSDIRQLQSLVHLLAQREALVKRRNEELLDVRVKEAVQKIHKCIGMGPNGGARHVSGFSSDKACQDFFSSLLLDSGHVMAIVTLVVTEKVHRIDSCIFGAFYTALSTSLIAADSTLITFLEKDYRNCIRLLCYLSVFQDADSRLDFIGLGAKLRVRLEMLCLENAGLLSGLKAVTVESIAKTLGEQDIGRELAPLPSEIVSRKMKHLAQTIMTTVTLIVSGMACKQDKQQSQGILDQIGAPDRTVCIDPHPNYLSGSDIRSQAAQSIITRSAHTNSFAAVAEKFPRESLTASLATALTSTHLQKIQTLVASLFDATGSLRIEINYHTGFFGRDGYFAIPTMTKIQDAVLEYAVALTRLEKVCKTHDVPCQFDTDRAVYIEGITRMLAVFQYQSGVCTIVHDDDLHKKEDSAAVSKALKELNENAPPETKHLLTKACFQASRYGILLYATILLDTPLPQEYALSVETSILGSFSDLLTPVCQTIRGKLFGDAASSSNQCIQLYVYFLALVTELVATMFTGCPLVEEHITEPHELCVGLIALAATAFSKTLITTSGLRREQRSTAHSYLTALSRVLLSLDNTNQSSLAWRCLGKMRQKGSKYVLSAAQAPEHQEMCAIYAAFRDKYYMQRFSYLAILGITIHRQKILATLYKPCDVDTFVQLVKVHKHGTGGGSGANIEYSFEPYCFFDPGDLSAIVRNCLEEGGTAAETTIHSLVMYIKSGAWS